MATIKEFRCFAHGEFESTEKTCPHGCPTDFVVQEFRTPPKIKSAGTKVVDAQLRGLAQDFGLSDLKNDKDGTSVMQSIRKGEDFSPKFVPIPHAKPGWSQRNEKPLQANAGNFLNGQKGENALGRVALEPPSPRFVNPPNPEPGAFS